MFSSFLFNFQFYFQFLSILHEIFTQDLAWGKLMIICILCIYAFCCLFWVIFFSYIDSTLLRKGAFPQNANIYISYRLGQMGILLMCLLFYSLQVFLTSVRWQTFTGVWKTASHEWQQVSSIRFWVFLLILTIPFRLFLNLLGPFQVYQKQLISPSPSCSPS